MHTKIFRTVSICASLIATTVYPQLSHAAVSQPGGTWSETCSGAKVSGTTLTASCKNEQGISEPTSIDLSNYVDWSKIMVTNENGALQCSKKLGD